MLVVGIAIADFHCITIEPLVQRTLAAAVVFATSVNERQYINSFIAQSIAGVCRYGKVTLYQVQYEALAGKVACTGKKCLHKQRKTSAPDKDLPGALVLLAGSC